MSGDPLSTVRAAALKQRLIGILTSTAAQKIDFFLGFMHVNGFGYKSVVNELSNGSIGIRLGHVPVGAAAAYRPKKKLFDFPNGTYGLSSGDQGSMVHEATHAIKALLYPFKAGMMVADTQDEAAAYVAGSLYMIYIGTTFTNPNTPAQLPFAKADLIAQSIQGTKGAIVSTQDEANLRAFVASNPVYARMGVNYYSMVYR